MNCSDHSAKGNDVRDPLLGRSALISRTMDNSAGERRKLNTDRQPGQVIVSALIFILN